VTLFDTAALYGFGANEDLGVWAAEHSEQTPIARKRLVAT
jgi:aryl-alcohol dehydrogenase-like predicted oxidoreductase